MFVVQEFGVIEIRSVDMGGRSLGNGQQFLDGSLALLVLQAFIAFPESFYHGAGHGFPGLLNDCLYETMGFRILYVQTQGVSGFL